MISASLVRFTFTRVHTVESRCGFGFIGVQIGSAGHAKIERSRYHGVLGANIQCGTGQAVGDQSVSRAANLERICTNMKKRLCYHM